MNQHGFLRIAAAVPQVTVANCQANADAIIALCRSLATKGVRLSVFPELSITAYTCGDLLHNSTLLDNAFSELHRIASATASLPMVMVVGLPLTLSGQLHNCAAVISSGQIKAIVSKTYLPNYNEFYEQRWFTPALANSTLFTIDGIRFGIEICEDLWAPIPPSSHLAMAGAEVVLNLSASNTVLGKRDYLTALIQRQSASAICAYVYAGAGFGESTTDVVFDGKAIIAENGTMLCNSAPWQMQSFSEITDVDVALLKRERMHNMTFGDCARRENSGINFSYIDVTPEAPAVVSDQLLRAVNPRPFVPSDPATLNERCTEIVNIQSAGLAQRLKATGCRSLVVGISGGLDSTLALLIAVRTFRRLGLDPAGITAVTMPGFGTTGRTHSNAMELMSRLGVSIREISIVPAVNQHFADIGHDPASHDVTYENSQARERTQLLMDIANQTNGMVLGTGDLSELALGWATYNGDHMSMYGVNAGVPKTLVRHLVRWFADEAAGTVLGATLLDIIDTPVSPELLPADEHGEIAQKTEDLVGPYDLHDFFLYHMLRHGQSPTRIYQLALRAFAGEFEPDTIKHWLRTFMRRFFAQQFKRSCLPDGPKVGSVCLSPRGDWRMPSDASSAMWLKEVDDL
jgi:NAD+ synthase (glutamine-hydrolysing)